MKNISSSKVKGYCLICFSNLGLDNRLTNLFSTNNIVCNKCLKSFKTLNKKEYINRVETWFLYEYDSFFKQLLYRYKGCYDIVLKDTFLHMFISKINSKYKGFTIVFPPSSKEDDFKRGFVHIKEIAKTTKLKVEELFYKKVNYKQSDQHFNERKYISMVIDIIPTIKVTNKKYLIVDDIYTSGSTLRTIIKLLHNKGVSYDNIKALILSKAATD